MSVCVFNVLSVSVYPTTKTNRAGERPAFDPVWLVRNVGTKWDDDGELCSNNKRTRCPFNRVRWCVWALGKGRSGGGEGRGERHSQSITHARRIVEQFNKHVCTHSVVCWRSCGFAFASAGLDD